MKTMKSILFAGMFVMLLSCNGKKTGKEQLKESDFTFAFLTDIHVEYAKNADKGFQLAIDKVNELNPEFVLTGGDLISDALGESELKALELYDLYLEKQKGFDMPVYNTLGNHEEFGIYEKSGVSRDNKLYGDKMYESKIGNRFYKFDYKGWIFYILDSVEETDDRRYYGNIDSTQIRWLMKDLSDLEKNVPIAIVTHIPFLTAQSQINGGSMAPNTRGLVVENSKEILDLFINYNLKLVLQGHLHRLEDIYINDIHFITGGAVSARWWDGPMGKMEEGFLIINVKGEKIDWEYIDYGWEAQ
jgi:3',5'-cyclic AMP phosphodiesterase CpdA